MPDVPPGAHLAAHLCTSCRPGGGCEGYLARLVGEIMPLVAAEFNTAVDPERVAFGGGSFAGERCSA